MTLLELLIVVVIIAVLASLGFLGISKGIQSAKAARTTDNLRQLGNGIRGVMTEGVSTGHTPPGMFPPYGGRFSGEGNGSGEFTWISLVAEYLGVGNNNPSDFNDKPVFTTDPSTTVFQNPLSNNKMGEGQSLPMAIKANQPEMSGSFLYNAYIGSYETSGNANSATGDGRKPRLRNDGNIPRPDITILLTEANDENLSASVWTGWAGTRSKGNYRDSCHCLMVDGHVELIPNSIFSDSAGAAYYFQITKPNKPSSVR